MGMGTGMGSAGGERGEGSSEWRGEEGEKDGMACKGSGVARQTSDHTQERFDLSSNPDATCIHKDPGCGAGRVSNFATQALYVVGSAERGAKYVGKGTAQGQAAQGHIYSEGPGGDLD